MIFLCSYKVVATNLPVHFRCTPKNRATNHSVPVEIYLVPSTRERELERERQYNGNVATQMQLHSCSYTAGGSEVVAHV